MADGIYKSVSLDQALEPDRGNPLTPTEYVQNAGVGALNVIGTGNTQMNAVVSPSGSTSTTLLHGQNYSPLILAYFRFSANGTRRLLPYNEFQTSIEASPGASKWTLDYELVNNNSITFFQRYNSGTYPTGTYYIEWYIFKEIQR